MTRKDELIVGILKSELKYIRKLLKEQQKQIKDIDKNGFDTEIHPAYHIDIRTGLSYTSGYCTGHIKLAENVIELLSMKDAQEIENLIAENKKIESENKKYLAAMWKDIEEDIEKEDKKKK